MIFYVMMTFLMCHLKSLIFDCISFTEGLILVCSQQTVRPLSLLEPLSPLCFSSMLPGVEVSCTKTINIKQYLNTNNFSSLEPLSHLSFPSLLPCVEVSCPKTIFKHKQFLIKSSQTTQLYTTKVFYKQFSCHHHIKKIIFRHKSF